MSREGRLHLLEDDPGTLAQDENLVVVRLSCSSSLEASLLVDTEDRKTTLPSMVEDDMKMAMNKTPMKTTPTKGLKREPSFNIYAANLKTGKQKFMKGQNVKYLAEQIDQGQQVHLTPARYSGQQFKKVFTKP